MPAVVSEHRMPEVIGIEYEGGIDTLLLALGRSPQQRALYQWARDTPGLHSFIPDYHRCQVEYWLWSQREALMGKRVMDVGISDGERRDWLGPGYFTFGLNEGDVIGDLCNFGLRDLDAVICTEVLEHCEAPWVAVDEIYAALRPGGLFLGSAPFIWPDHRTNEYPDLWRFTEQGWRLLLRRFEDVRVAALRWTDEGAALYDQLRRWEGFGFPGLVTATTGYVVSARKGGGDA